MPVAGSGLLRQPADEPGAAPEPRRSREGSKRTLPTNLEIPAHRLAGDRPVTIG